MTETRNSAPALRFKDEQRNEYPDWEERKLGQIFTVRYGKEHKYLSDGNVPVIGTGGVIRYANGVLYSEPSVLIGRKGTIDKPQFINQPFWAVDTVFFTEIEPSNVSYFVFLIVLKINWKRYNEASGLPSLSANTIKGIRAKIPSKEEQQKIASFLSSVDTKIEQLGKKKTLLEQYKKGMMQKLFSQEIRFKDGQGNDYPDWKERRFDEIANIIMGTSPKSSAYNHSSEGLPLIQGNTDVKNRRSAPRIYTSEITKECLPNDTLLSVRAPVGEVSRAIHHACIGRGISAVRVKAIALQEYIFHYLVWHEPKWKGLSQGSTFESVNTKSIESLEILVPSKLEQQKIANFLSAIDKKIDFVAEQLEQARTFKKGLLQQMFI